MFTNDDSQTATRSGAFTYVARLENNAGTDGGTGSIGEVPTGGGGGTGGVSCGCSSFDGSMFSLAGFGLVMVLSRRRRRSRTARLDSARREQEQEQDWLNALQLGVRWASMQVLLKALALVVAVLFLAGAVLTAMSDRALAATPAGDAGADAGPARVFFPPTKSSPMRPRLRDGGTPMYFPASKSLGGEALPGVNDLRNPPPQQQAPQQNAR